MCVKSRILEYIEYKKIPIRQFEEKSNLSNGYISSMRKGFGTEKLENVLNSFPDLNREWLLYGEGEMLKFGVQQNNVNGDNIHGHNVSVDKSPTDGLIELLKTKDDQINKSQEQISKSQEQIDRLIGLIEKMNNI